MFIRWLMLIMPCKPDGYECGPYLQDETGQKRTRKKKRTARDSKKEQGRKRKDKEGQGSRYFVIKHNRRWLELLLLRPGKEYIVLHTEVLPCSIDRGPPKKALPFKLDLFIAPNSNLPRTPPTFFHQTHCSHSTLVTPPNLLCATHSIQSIPPNALHQTHTCTELVHSPLPHFNSTSAFASHLLPSLFHSSHLARSALVHYPLGLQRVLFEASSILELKQRPSTDSTGQ